MPYVSMNELLPAADKNGYAVGAFNIFNHQTARAVICACEELEAPVIIQTSVKTVKQFGPNELMDFLRPLVSKARVPVAVHLDHCTDAAFAKVCIDAGWSSVMIDGSKLTLEENIKISNEIVDYATSRRVSVEGELGAIVGVEDDIVVDEGSGMLADKESSIIYVQQSGIDAFAPAIGTAHGVYKGEPRLDFDLFETLHKTISVPLVIHGGTGLEDEVFRRLVMLGASKINVSTAIKLAYLEATKNAAAQTDPLKFDDVVFRAVVDCVKGYVELFGACGKA